MRPAASRQFHAERYSEMEPTRTEQQLVVALLAIEQDQWRRSAYSMANWHANKEGGRVGEGKVQSFRQGRAQRTPDGCARASTGSELLDDDNPHGHSMQGSISRSLDHGGISLIGRSICGREFLQDVCVRCGFIRNGQGSLLSPGSGKITQRASRAGDA